MGFGQLMAEHGADRSVDVGDLGGEAYRGSRVESLTTLHDQLLIEGLVQSVILTRTAVQVLVHECRVRLVQHRRQVQLVCLPVLGGLLGVQRPDLADHLVDRAESQLRHELSHLLRDEQHEVLDELRLAVEPLTQQGVLGGDADGAGVEVTHPHHDAARHHQRSSREAELLATQQGGDDDVTARLQLAVDLHYDAIAKSVEQQCLLRLGQA